MAIGPDQLSESEKSNIEDLQRQIDETIKSTHENSNTNLSEIMVRVPFRPTDRVINLLKTKYIGAGWENLYFDENSLYFTLIKKGAFDWVMGGGSFGGGDC